MEAYTGMVWQVCAKRLQNPEDIKECVNSTFADFCMAYERFDPQKGSLQNYLCTIADRRALERYRKISATRRAEEEYRNLAGYSIREPHPPVNPEQADLKDALEHMEQMDAQLLRMRYYNGMTFREIAGQLCLPYETVRKRGQRSLKKLRSSIT